MNTSMPIPVTTLDVVIDALLNTPTINGGIPSIVDFHWWAIEFQGQCIHDSRGS